MSSIFDRATIGTTNNQLVLNDFTAKPTFIVEMVRPQQRDIREQDVPIPANNGVSDFLSYEGKSHFLLSGTMFALGEDEYYRGREKLRNVGSLEIQQADALSDNGYVPYIWNEAGRMRMLMVKALYVDGMQEDAASGYQQDFTFICKVKNPVIYDANPVTTVLNMTTPVVIVGSAGYPMGFPAAFGAATYPGVGGQVVNAGSIGAYPAFVINGPINVPRITNLTTGQYLEINVNLPTVSDTLNIFYDVDTPPTITQGGVSVYNKKNAGSTFWKVKPGVNQLQLTGQTIGNGAAATVSFYSSYPLS